MWNTRHLYYGHVCDDHDCQHTSEWGYRVFPSFRALLVATQ